jgi:hypothetical protein
MGKWKSLRKHKEQFGEELGTKLWIEEREAKRERWLALIKKIPGGTGLLSVLGMI